MSASAEIRAAPSGRELRRLWTLLPVDRRREAVRLLGLMLLGGLAELATVGSVVPFLYTFAPR